MKNQPDLYRCEECGCEVEISNRAKDMPPVDHTLCCPYCGYEIRPERADAPSERPPASHLRD